VDFVEGHIPDGQDKHVIPVTEEPCDSVAFQRIEILDGPEGFDHYATLRIKVAGYAVEILSITSSPNGEISIGNDADNVSQAGLRVDDLGLERFIGFFDRLLPSE
jgi:hypothetical protein